MYKYLAIACLLAIGCLVSKGDVHARVVHHAQCVVDSPGGGNQPNVPANSDIKPALLLKLMKFAANHWNDTVGRCWQAYHRGDLTIYQFPCECQWELTLVGGGCVIAVISSL